MALRGHLLIVFSGSLTRGCKGLRFDKLMDAAYGGKFGGETKTDRDKAQKQRKKGEMVTVPFQRRTNVCIGLIIQDDVWADWMVLAESNHHEGLPSRFLFPFAQGRMVGPLRLKNFFSQIYAPLVTKFFSMLLCTFSARKDVLHPTAPVGEFKLKDSEERFLKNARVICKCAAPPPGSHRRKCTTGLQKAGYWVPALASESHMLSGIVDATLKGDTMNNGFHGASVF